MLLEQAGYALDGQSRFPREPFVSGQVLNLPVGEFGLSLVVLDALLEHDITDPISLLMIMRLASTSTLFATSATTDGTLSTMSFTTRDLPMARLIFQGLTRGKIISMILIARQQLLNRQSGNFTGKLPKPSES